MKDKKTREEKIKEKLLDANYCFNIIKEFVETVHENIKLEFTIDGPPENYARERKGRGKHFYNPKSSKMEAARNTMKKSLTDETKEKLKNLFENENASYYVSLDITYYMPIQKSSSFKDIVLKENGLIKPEIRPDIDNYDKFILDTLHEVAYSDDSHVIEIHSYKKYSINPRTEIKAIIEIIKE